MKLSQRILLLTILVIHGLEVLSQNVIADSAGIIVGAIRWDWTGGGTVNEAVEKSLGPKQWHYRVPFFGAILNDSTVEATCSSQECVDQEILYARENGLDYWAFLLYPEGSDLDLPLRRYLTSGYNSTFRFAVIGADSIDRIINYFKHPSYQTVLEDRPLYFIFGKFDPGHIAALKAACATEGIAEPYVVPMKDQQNPGEDAISRYWYNGMTFGGETDGAPYSVLALSAVANWNLRMNAGYTQIPLVSGGTDGRPRIENPPPWIPDPGFYEKYFEAPSPRELADNLQNAVNFVDSNPVNCEAKAILIYAWNEHDEGGWLTPTLDTGNTSLIDDSRLKALKEVVWPTNPADPRSKDATIKSILVNGDTLAGFHPDTTHYQILIPEITTEVPVITVLTKEKYTRVKVTRPEELTGISTIQVTSEDGSVQKIYHLDFKIDYVPRDSIGWEFNTPFDTEGWSTVWPGHATITVPDSILLIDVLDNYPEITSWKNLQINAATYDKISIGVKNNTTSDDWYFKIFTREGGEKFIDLVPGTMDTGFREYTLDLGSVPEWQGTINQIGWLVARQVGTGTVEIDYIRLKLTDNPLSDDATLSSITVNDAPVNGFSPDQELYAITLPAGTETPPLVTASATHAGAVVKITQAPEADSMAVLKVISQSGLFIKHYTLNFRVPELLRVPFFYTDFREGVLPDDWPCSVPGYTASVEEESMVLTIDKNGTDAAYTLGNLNIGDFDLNPYMTIHYQSMDSLNLAITLSGADGILSGSEIFSLPAVDQWNTHTLNLSALANESWGCHLDSILLVFEPELPNFSGIFAINEIMIADSVDGKVFQLQVDQPPELEVNLGQDTTLLDGDEITLDSGNPGAVTLWSTGATTQTIVVDSAGTYYVDVTGAGNCTATDSIRITQDAVWFADAMDENPELHIFPNPNDGHFFLDPGNIPSEGEFKVTVTSVSGSIVYTDMFRKEIPGGITEIQLKDAPSGMYLLKVERKDESTLRKLLVH